MTVENIADEQMTLYYQINYALAPVADDVAYFHAHFRRVNPLPYKEVYTILDNVRGQGQFVGLYMAWGVNNSGWWGEGEIKFFMDGDEEFPTICGTGTEDYFCGSYNFENQATKEYQEYTTPYAGLCQVLRPDGVYRSQTRFGMYRWHITDPIRFTRDLRVTIQALGWRNDRRYLPLQDDIASVAFWYQSLPTTPFRICRNATCWRLSDRLSIYSILRHQILVQGHTQAGSGGWIGATGSDRPMVWLVDRFRSRTG